MNNENNNIDIQLNNNQNINYQQVNGGFYQQQTNQLQNNINAPKKRNKALIIGISILGVFVLGIVILISLFSISEGKEMVWQSGKVEIMGKNIQLPCDVSDFERTLNTTILNDDIWDGIVKIKAGYNSQLMFKVNIENNKVTGIMIDVYPSDADEYDRIMEENERNVANKIVFPGNITSDSTVDVVKETYKTTPINVYYNYFSETIEEMTEENDGWISSSYRYHDSEWEIEVHTKTNIRNQKEEITNINYWYLK